MKESDKTSALRAGDVLAAGLREAIARKRDKIQELQLEILHEEKLLRGLVDAIEESIRRIEK